MFRVAIRYRETLANAAAPSGSSHWELSSAPIWRPACGPLPTCRWSGRLPSAVGRVSGTSQTFYRYRPKTCWPMPNGTPSVGVPAPRESSRRVLLRFACESPTDHRSGSGTRGNSISPGKRLGSSANTVRRGRKILSRQPAGEGRPAHLGGNHQGTMDLRAGSSATERRTRSRSL